jgi:hypothetical protein
MLTATLLEGTAMRRGLEFVVLAVLLTALPACSATPTGPDRTGPAEFDTTALFSRIAGSYTLTFDADDSCRLPPSLQQITYDVVLEPTRYRYLAVRVSGKPFVGDLWVLATEEQGFTLRWNVDCDTADTVGATTFYLCGEGDAQVTDGNIAGVLAGRGGYLDVDHRPVCTNATNRFLFRPSSVTSTR